MLAFKCISANGCKAKACGHSVPHLQKDSNCNSFCDVIKKQVTCVEKDYDEKEISNRHS